MSVHVRRSVSGREVNLCGAASIERRDKVDGAPAVVNFQVRGDTYVVPKVLERGYLALGKERFNFQQGR